MKNKQIELLAPAGGWEQLKAAAACGADAVYLGAGTLNARRSADNFKGDQLREAVEFCHIRGMKVHLTMNTVILERELAQAEELAALACAVGVDALLVQDWGLVRLLRRAAPGMPLHASTQMAIHNLSGAQQLEEMGFTRVVLAREMSREEIAAVVAATSLETEVFIHGALCMCVSGQCYFSSVVGERSGNRGLCAQPCRLPFYEKQAERYGLSLKDMSLVEQVPELQALGVTSLKIEGRMKRPEYVAAAVTACRQARAGESVDLQSLRSVFSRSGFTNGYYKNQLGTDMFGVRQKEDVVAAQGVLGDLAGLYRKEAQRVPLEGLFQLEADAPITLTLHDDAGHHVQVQGEAPELARNKPTTTEMVEQSLRKLGGTPYDWQQLTVQCGEGLALPVARLNALRREAVEQITAQRAQPRVCPFDAEKWQTEPVQAAQPIDGKPALWGRFARLEQVPEDVSALERVILPANEALRVTAGSLLEKLAVELPRIDFSDYKHIAEPLKTLQERGVRHATAGNLGAVRFARENGFAVTGDWSLNATNRASLQQLADLGCTEATFSWELNLADARRIAQPLPTGLLLYGYLPLMIVRNCPARVERACANCSGLVWMKDRLGNRFAVSCGGNRGMVEIFNREPLWMADRRTEANSFAFHNLYFTFETQEECAEVIAAYTGADYRPAAYTRGLYYRNLQ